jgi:hypothetical protein
VYCPAYAASTVPLDWMSAEATGGAMQVARSVIARHPWARNAGEELQAGKAKERSTIVGRMRMEGWYSSIAVDDQLALVAGHRRGGQGL